MGNWVKEVKEHWNEISDSNWYKSLRTDEKITRLKDNPALAFLPAIDASFWYTYDELVEKRPEELVNINDWKKNPMAALPAWITLVSRKS